MTTAQADITDLLSVDLDLTDGRLTIGGHEVPYTSPGIKVRVDLDGLARLFIPTVALGGRIHGQAEVTYGVTFIDTMSDVSTSSTAEGSTIPIALRALADKIEAG